VNEIAPVQNTNLIRYADFVRLTTPSATYRFATTPTAITIPYIDPEPFTALGQLVKVGDATRDIKSTSNETTVTLTGIEPAMLALVLGTEIKGAQIEMWHGFFNANGELISSQLPVVWQNNSNLNVNWQNLASENVNWTSITSGTLYKFFNGFINSFSISEQWFEEIRGYVGTITVNASSIQLILQNRISGRYTNNNSWQFYSPNDTSMNRVSFIETINYAFGREIV
jgi:hypothetical protein